ncbi:MAG: nitroreductase family protein [Alphaproteobacteria bacterium]
MLSIDELYQLAASRRSIRGYDRRKNVPDEVVRKILDCARWAPSGGNGQPWEFIVIRDEKTRYQIADIFLKQQEHKKEMEMAARGDAKMTGDGFRHAPIHIIVLGDPRVKETYPVRTMLDKAESHFFTGLANATLLIHLAATALGLATQYVSDASSPYMETMLKVLLGVPEPLRVYHLIPLGYASRPIPARPRRELDEMIHYERYDMTKYRDDREFQKFVMTASRKGYYGKKIWVEDDTNESADPSTAKS